jgi:hypothetical protein
MEQAQETKYNNIDVYEHFATEHLVDSYNNWVDQIVVEETEKRILNLKVSGYFSED